MAARKTATHRTAKEVEDPKPLVAAQPQSPQAAAPSKGMFLYTNDAWSQDYFNGNDLHSLERKLFG